MLFTDPLFLFYFLPFSLIALRLTLGTRKDQSFPEASRIVLFGLTLVFYGFHSVWWLYPFLFAVVCDFGWASLLRRSTKPQVRRWLLTGSVIQNVSLLALFKYRSAFSSFLPLPEVIVNGVPAGLPAGISFYTFESLSFVIDIYRRDIEPPKKITGFLSFIGMFPRFVAGPIVRYKEIVAQFADYRGMQVRKGLLIFAAGLFVKACFADSLSIFVPYAFGAEHGVSTPAAWVGVLAYALQLYLDFSAYSQMAIGLGLCLGFQFPQNFNLPYHASSMQDFWRRWHMSLSRWLRDYVYISLGGSRGSPARTYLNLFLTMVIGGVWHGSGWGFLVWGIWHGGLLCLERYWNLSTKVPARLYSIFVFLFVVFGWVPFRARTMSETWGIWKAMCGFSDGITVFNFEALQIHPLALSASLGAALYVFVIEPIAKRGNWAQRLERSPWIDWAMVPVTALSLLLLFGADKVPFLYFQF